MVSNECTKYQNLGFVCPTSLQDGFFTIAAIDNFDKIFSSTTSANSFHGTTISVFQHSHVNAPFQSNPRLSESQNTLNSVYELPESYTDIMPTAECRPETSVTAAYVSDIKSVQQNTEIQASAWMKTISRVDSLTAQNSLSFSSY